MQLGSKLLPVSEFSGNTHPCGGINRRTKMALPEFTMRQLIEAGAHFGHQSHRWNPKMAQYIFGARNNIHILDLAQTVPMLHRALQAVSDATAKGGRVLFVGTKRQAQEVVADAAKRSAQYYVNSRWLGGMLTNWKTISASIQRLRKVDELLSGGAQGLTKKERLLLSREHEKLSKALGGIKDMGGTPDILFIIDTNKEQLAIKEAQRLGIPVAAIVDTNSDPDGITYPIPANDDASRALLMYCDLIARAAVDGIARSQGNQGVDIGAMSAPAMEILPVEVGGFERLTAPRGAPDDMTKIHGVGPELATKINEAGIFHYVQITSLTEADIATLDAELKLKGRIVRDKWVEQVTALSAA
jgi:small subunit ribosomal protein S2